jgi:Winged helix DNA-binding domain
LHREASSVTDLAVLDIGVQDSSADGARLAFDARLAESPPVDNIGPGQPLALVWSLRGAPYVHRRRDLDRLAAGLWPLSAADAGARMNQTRPHLVAAGLDGLAGFVASTEALRSVVTAPTAKGAVSTALTPLVHDGLKRYCGVCKVTHVGEMALRATMLAAGLELQPGTAPPVLTPRVKARWPVKPSRAAVQRLITDYLILLGPAGPGEVAGYLDTRRAEIEAIWPAGLAEVSVDGAPAWLPAERLDVLRAAPPAELVRLLNPFDPYLQARDRDLIVPDPAAQKTLWPVLGRPGVLLVNGEVAGVWRPRSSAKSLTVAVESIVPLPKSVWTSIEDEANRIGAVRRAAGVRITRGPG